MIDELRAVLGDAAVLTGAEIPRKNCSDWSKLPDIEPLALVRPATTEEVAHVLRLCNRYGQAVTPQGGLTGLVGGARPSPSTLALSLERLTGVEQVDARTATLTARAGTTLETVQRAADDAGLLFALDIGSRGSCTLGGNLATNAGGNRVLRYGMARDLTLGLEVVLADGTILSSMNTMVKNNTGLDLKQLFIGTEGTLGVITRAVVRLHSKPAGMLNAFCRCADFSAVLALLASAQTQLADTVSSFEVMWPSFYDLVITRLPQLRRPLASGPGLYCLLEATAADLAADGARFEAFLSQSLERGMLTDAVIAQSQREAGEFWAIRGAGSEYPRILGEINSFDISFRRDDIGRVVNRLESELAARWPGIHALTYGHVGDGNIHLIVNLPGVTTQPKEEISDLVYGVVREFQGSISGEHGIGTRKLNYLSNSRSAEELAFMRRVKRAVDPGNLLNPGKVLPAPETGE
jgi:FAD/FMN-containing dehydrogenase